MAPGVAGPRDLGGAGWPPEARARPSKPRGDLLLDPRADRPVREQHTFVPLQSPSGVLHTAADQDLPVPRGGPQRSEGAMKKSIHCAGGLPWSGRHLPAPGL